MCEPLVCEYTIPRAPKIKFLKSDKYIPELILEPINESDKLKLINAPLVRSIVYFYNDIPELLLEPIDNDKTFDRLYLKIN